MALAEPPRLRLIDGAATDRGAAPSGARLDDALLIAVRSARPLVDRMDRADRARLAAVVVSHPGANAEQAARIARHACGALSLDVGWRLPVVGLEGQGALAALHVAWAATAQAGSVALVVGFAAQGGGVVLVGRDRRGACWPLPPVQAPPPPGAGEAVVAKLCGAALALAVAKGGLRRRAILRAASPGLARVEAAWVLREAGMPHVLASSVETRLGRSASVEAALAEAATHPPAVPTLLWTRGPEGRVSACLLGGD